MKKFVICVILKVSEKNITKKVEVMVRSGGWEIYVTRLILVKTLLKLKYLLHNFVIF